MTETQVRDRLQKEGYSEVSNLTKSGQNFTATAKKDGQTVQLEIDGSTGLVRPKT